MLLLPKGQVYEAWEPSKSNVLSESGKCWIEEYFRLLFNTEVRWLRHYHYKPEDRGFDSRWYHFNFSLTQFFWPHCGPEVDSAPN